MRIQQEGSFANPEESFYKKQNRLAPGSWPSQPLEPWEINFCCLSHPVNDIFVLVAQTKIEIPSEKYSCWYYLKIFTYFWIIFLSMYFLLCILFCITLTLSLSLLFIKNMICTVAYCITLEKGMAPHASILAWRSLWREEAGGLLSMGSHRVGHDWSDLACMHTASHVCNKIHLPFLLFGHLHCFPFSVINSSQMNIIVKSSYTLQIEIMKNRKAKKFAKQIK